jgi:ADP-ribosylglycohydrolase
VRGMALGESLAGGARRHERELSAAVRALRGAAADDATAVAFVRAATELMSGADVAAVRARLPGAVPDRVLAHVLQKVLPKATRDLAALRESIIACAQPHLGPNFSRAHPNAGVALLGGVHALAVALADGIEPRAALESVAALGQDADLVAALCGALLGARFGSDWI